MTLDEIVTQLRSAYGAQLSCIVLYGSAATDDHVPEKSDYNVLVLLEHIGTEMVVAASSAARAWRDGGNPPPLTMTVSEWRRSADIFPMEYADILDRHRVLHGAPPFDGIIISREHLRHQLEQQVMGRLLQLRQGALLAGADGKRQATLVSLTLSAIMVLFRALVRLTGDTPSGDNVAIVARVAHIAGFDPAPFTHAAEHHRDNTRIAPAHAATVLAGCLSGLERLDAFLDSSTM